MLTSLKLPPRPTFGALEIVLALVLGTLATLLMIENVNDPEGPHAAFAAIPAFVPLVLVLLWRRTAPIGALAVTCAVLALHFIAFGFLVRCGIAFPLLGLLVFAAAARLEPREGQIALAVAVGGAVLTGLTDDLGPGVLTVGFPAMLVCWGLGRLSHKRNEMNAELAARNEALRVARDERARLEVATDRAQLSGDLERLLQERLAALAELADRGPQTVADGTAVLVLKDIERESRATLEEMRSLVGALRDEGGQPSLHPQPTLTSLDALLLREKGANAQLTVEGDQRTLPAGVELSAYRVVEHLLDALDDTPEVGVHVRFAVDALELTVEGQPRRRSIVQAAVARAREGVELHRGSLVLESSSGRSSAVATLPLA